MGFSFDFCIAVRYFLFSLCGFRVACVCCDCLVGLDVLGLVTRSFVWTAGFDFCGVRLGF